VIEPGKILTEKYRPKRLEDIVGQQAIVEKLQGFVSTGKIPHMLMSGPAGTGKTTSLLALLRELYGSDWKDFILELNASDEGRVDVMRGKIKEFTKIQLNSRTGYKVIFLDESDYLTTASQAILRRTMEKTSRTCRFVLSCNYPKKIIEPIQDRCACFRFKMISVPDMIGYLKPICENEKIDITEPALDLLAAKSRGSMRKPINVLETILNSNTRHVNEKTILELTYWVDYKKITELVEEISNLKFTNASNIVKEMLFTSCYDSEEVVSALMDEFCNTKLISGPVKLKAISKLSETNTSISQGSDPFLTLRGFIAYVILEVNK